MKKLVMLMLIILSGMSKVVAQGFDMDIYPPDSLKGKGILLNMNIEEKAMHDEHWWLSAGDFLIDAPEYDHRPIQFNKEHPTGYSVFFDDYTLDIPVNPIRVCGQDEKYYHISSRYPKHLVMMGKVIPVPANIRIRKSQMDSLGYQFVSCERLLECYKNGNLVHFNPVGMSILPPMQVVSPEPHKGSMGEFSSPYPFYMFFILRSAASPTAPFISIIEPRPANWPSPRGYYQCEVVAKDNYWYEIRLSFAFGFGGVFWDGFYQGETYTGYWRAPFDEAGFPYGLVDMVDSQQWPVIIQKLKM